MLPSRPREGMRNGQEASVRVKKKKKKKKKNHNDNNRNNNNDNFQDFMEL